GRSGAQRGRRCRGEISRGHRRAADADRKFLMRRYVVFGALALVLVAGCGRDKDKDDEAKAAAPVVTVDVAPVLLSKIQRTIRADGLLYARQQAAIIPKIAAPVKKNYVVRGARVRAGQLLVELENQDLTGAATESRAALTQA